MQVLLGAVLVDAVHTAFEDGEISLNRIRRHIAARILFVGVIDRFVRCKLPTDARIKPAFIRVQARLSIDIVQHDIDHSFFRCIRNMERANLAAALDKADDNALSRFALLQRLF